MAIKINNFKAADIFLRNIWNFLKIYLVFLTPPIILFYTFWGNDDNIVKIINRLGVVGAVVLDTAINYMLIVFFLFYLVAIVKSVDALIKGGNPGLRASYRKAFKAFGPYLWIKILSLFKALCWALLLIVPGIGAWFLYNFSGMAYLVDGKKGSDAIQFSRSIIKKNLGRYLWEYLFMALMTVILCVVVTMHLNNFITYFLLKDNPMAAQMFIYAGILFYGLALSYFMAYYYFLYDELKEKGVA